MTDAEVEKKAKNQSEQTEEANSQEGVAEPTPIDEERSSSEGNSSEDWRTKAAYLAAEMENMKKRFERDKRDFLRFANEELLKKFLPVMDNMILALNSVKSAKSSAESSAPDKLVASLLQGFEMTIKQFEQTLESVGVEFVGAQRGTEFNPEHHEAMGQDMNKDLKDGVISSEFQRGFKLNGRVVRPAKVIVNKAPEENTSKKDGE
ncbi:nucleotide exchange factor GrpE [bacterium]|nr:nucleotide exchange factor GrpE [bacterium]